MSGCCVALEVWKLRVRAAGPATFIDFKVRHEVVLQPELRPVRVRSRIVRVQRFLNINSSGFYICASWKKKEMLRI